MDEEKFIKKWGKRRAKGKFLYIVLYGFILLGIASGIGFLVVSVLIEKAIRPNIDLSQFMHTTRFFARLLISVIIFPVAGFFIGLSNWKTNERKYKTLVRYF